MFNGYGDCLMPFSHFHTLQLRFAPGQLKTLNLPALPQETKPT